jgi:integrase
VDWRSGTMLVKHSYTYGRLDVPKGGKSRRVEMTTPLRQMLRAVYEARFERVVALDAEQQAAPESEKAADSADALIFPDEAGGYLDDANLRRRVWLPLLAAARLRKRRLHDCRHTFATLHLQGGTDPVWVSAMLGHASVGFTLSTYAHLPRNNRGGHADRILTAPNYTATALPPAQSHDATTADSALALVSQG